MRKELRGETTPKSRGTVVNCESRVRSNCGLPEQGEDPSERLQGFSLFRVQE